MVAELCGDGCCVWIQQSVKVEGEGRGQGISMLEATSDEM